MYCCVPNCYEQHSRRHRFPRPNLNPLLFEIWVSAIKNPLFKNKTKQQIHKNYLVCDRHFDDKVKVPETHRGLKCEAFPTLFLSLPDGYHDHVVQKPCNDLDIEYYNDEGNIINTPTPFVATAEQEAKHRLQGLKRKLSATLGKILIFLSVFRLVLNY